MSWKLSVCGPCGSGHSFPNLNSSISVFNRCDCPFDRLYNRIVSVNLSATRLTLPNDQDLLNLLVVEIVSSVESYFREILSSLIMICPISKRDAADFPISLGSAMWGFEVLQARIGFEHSSLAGSKSLQSLLSKLNLINTNKAEEPIKTLLVEYDKICELRHLIAHSKGLITGKNALIVGIGKHKTHVEIKTSLLDIQNIAALSLALCRAFHQEIFMIIGKRWANNWKKEFVGWDKRMANRQFKKIWNLFYSQVDSGNILGPNKLSEKQVREAIINEFNVTY